MPIKSNKENNILKQKDFNNLFDNYYELLCRFSYTIVHDKDTTEDIVQEQFVYLWENWNSLPEIKNIKAYLYKSIKNKSLNHLHKAYHRLKLGDFDNIAENDVPVNETTPLHIIEQNELQEIIFNAIEALPKKCKEIYKLKRIEQYSNKEIAENLNVSIKTVEHHITTANKKLKEQLISKVGLLLALACILKNF